MKCDVRVETGADRGVVRITGILLIHHRRHAFECGHDLGPRTDAMMEPVGDVLTRDAQRRAILHERDIVIVGYLAAADAKIDPPHHVPQDALRIVIEFLFDLRRRPRRVRRQRRCQDLVERRAGARCQRLLDGGNVDLMVMQRVQSGGCGRGYPRRVRAGPRVRDLRAQHVRHEVRHRPHALADLGVSAEAARETDVDVLPFIGIQPDRLLEVVLARYRRGFHRGVDLIAGAVEEAGVDEHDALLHRPDALQEIDRGAPFFIHDADLQGMPRQSQQIFDRRKQVIRERDLLGTVQFRLDDVYRTRARIFPRAVRADVVERDQRGHDCIDEGLRDGSAVQRDRVGEHVVSDVADQHETASGQHQLRSVGCAVGAIGIQPAHHRLSGLRQLRRERPLHQSQPVAIDHHLVGWADGGDRVFAVLDGRDRGLEHHITDAGRIAAADVMLPVHVHFDMKPVMFEEHHGWRGRVAVVADEGCGIRECRGNAVVEAYFEAVVPDAIAGGVAVASFAERKILVQELPGEFDHLRATPRIVSAAPGRTVFLRDGIRPIQGVIQASPAGIRGVQCIARVIDGDHQLGSRHGRDLRVDIRGGNLERRFFRHQIPDLEKEGAVSVGVEIRARVAAVPLVDQGLQMVAFRQ